MGFQAGRRLDGGNKGRNDRGVEGRGRDKRRMDAGMTE